MTHTIRDIAQAIGAEAAGDVHPVKHGGVLSSLVLGAARLRRRSGAMR